MNDMVVWLQDWFASQCNGRWEQNYGVSLETLDNPGWHLRIDLASTRLENKAFRMLKSKVSNQNWMICRKEEDIWHGYGDPTKLSQIIATFKEWVES